MANIRIGNVAVGCPSYITIISQAVVAKYHRINDLNIKMNNFNYYIDLENDEHGKIDVKGGRLTVNDGYDAWMFHTKRKRKKCICTFYLVGFSKNLENIEIICTIPDKDLTTNSSIALYKNTVRSMKYDIHKEDPKPYDDIYQNWIKYLGDRKFIGIEDIIEWSNMYDEENK